MRRLVEELEPERDLSRNPLFQVMFALQNAPMPPLELGDLRLSLMWLDTLATRFDLEAHVWEEPEGLKVFSFTAQICSRPPLLSR